ncbi:MAG: DUF3179 domain-containing protein [Pseudomonadota bacterium]
MARFFFAIAALLTLGLPAPAPAQDAADGPARVWSAEWPRTDFDRNSVDLTEIFSGGPPKDGIPAIDDPSFAPASETDLPGREPVLVLELEGETPRAYPLRYLTWHEIVNDRIGDRPVIVTFCPLCNSALAFDGVVEGRELSFGVSGKLRHSDMIMYDRQTESWWQQFHGEAVVGELLGARLTVLPSWLEDWAGFRARHPQGLTMQEPQAWRRAYGMNPYAGYDSSPTPFLYRGEPPPHGVPALARVVRVGERAWPLTRLAAAGEIEEAGVRLVWRTGQASALDAGVMADGRDVGTVRVFDAETGAPAVAEVVFAFAFHAFEPDGEWMLGK